MDVPTRLSGCLRDTCEEEGCSLSLQGMHGSISVLSMDCVKSELTARGRTADFAVLSNSSRWIAMIELKGGQDLKAEQIVKQIQSGLNMLMRGMGNQRVDQFFPILVHRSRRDPSSALSGRLIKLGNAQRRIIVAKCGSRLSSLVRPKRRAKRTR